MNTQLHTPGNVQRTTYNVHKNFLISKITTWLLMLTLIFGSNYVYSQNVLPSSGNVGIGTTQPTEILEVNGGSLKVNNLSGNGDRYVVTDPTGRLKEGPPVISPPIGGNPSGGNPSGNNPNANWNINGNNNITGANFIGTLNSADLIFKTTNIEQMRISSNGNVGIGVVSPTSKLDIAGSIKATGMEINGTANFSKIQVLDSVKVGFNSIWLGGADQHTGNNNSIYTTQGALLIQNQSNSDNTIINPYSGKVGIGTYQPQAKLQINEIRVDNLFSPNPQFYTCEPLARFTHYFQKNDPLGCENINVLLVDHKEHNGGIKPLFAVNNNGYVGIGTNSPERSLHVKSYTPCVGTNCPISDPNDPLPATTYLRIEDAIVDINGNNISSNKWDFAVSGNQNRFFIQRVNANAEALTILNNNNIGVGTSNPQAKLHIVHEHTAIRFERSGYKTYDIRQSAGNSLSFVKVDNPTSGAQNPIVMYLADTGNVGINAGTSPLAKLHVNGNVMAWDAGVVYMGFSSTSPLTSPNSLYGNGERGLYLHNGVNDGWNFIKCVTSTGDKFMVKGNGTVYAKEYRATMSNFPDYVFDENYELRSIKEVEQYIKTHKHLPGIPSAKEAESEEGVNLGELQRKMLEKIEEMMLYIIELKNENEALKSEIKTIKK